MLKANGPYHCAFFMIVIFLGSFYLVNLILAIVVIVRVLLVMVQSGSGFYLVNLILAIVAMSYDDCQKREQAEIEEEYAAALVHMYACLYGAHTQLEPCRTLPIRTRISSRT